MTAALNNHAGSPLGSTLDATLDSVHTLGTAAGAIEDARAAIEQMRIAQDALDSARLDRDRAIHRIHQGQGLSAPQIARTLGLSISLVRLTLRMPKP